MANSKFEMILCIVNTGFSETVMDAAKEVGARGGTVVHARGTANKEDVLHAVYRSAGLKTEGQGIAFSVPVDDVVGITAQSTDKAPAQPKQSKTDDNKAPSDVNKTENPDIN